MPSLLAAREAQMLATQSIMMKFALHTVPWGILHTQAICVVGNGVVVHLPGFFKEINGLEAQGVLCTGKLFVSDRAHLPFDLHQIVDGLPEAELGGDHKVWIWSLVC